MIKTHKWLHSTVPSEAGIDTRSSGPYFGRHLQFYYLSNKKVESKVALYQIIQKSYVYTYIDSCVYIS